MKTSCTISFLISSPRLLKTLYIALSFLIVSHPSIYLAAARKVGETCAADSDCDGVLHCDTCGGSRARCVRIQPLSPASKVKGLPFNRYSWLTTHNSFAISGSKSGTGSALLAPTNQQDSVTSQLNTDVVKKAVDLEFKNGVRGLMLDMYDFNNDIWLCHSFGGQCFNVTAFQLAINVLKEVQVFLDANHSEIITIFIEDYVTSPQGLTKVFNASGLTKFWFPVSRMPKNGENWPVIDDMISKNQRLVVFTSKSAKEASEGIAYQWRYVVENQYGNDGMKAGSCPNRAESSPVNAVTRSLFLQNYFPTNPNSSEACKDNSAPLISMLNTCYQSAGKRWPNFIAVDFYKKSEGGGAAEATDVANGRLLCGCSNIAYCNINASFRTCDVPADAPDASYPQTGGPPPPSGSSIASSGCKPFISSLWPLLMFSIATCFSHVSTSTIND